MKGLPVADQLKPWFNVIKDEVKQGKIEINKLLFPSIAGILYTRNPQEFPTPCPEETFICELAQIETPENKEKFSLTLSSYKNLPKYLQPKTLLEDLDKKKIFDKFMNFITSNDLPLNALANELEKILRNNIFYKQHHDNIIKVIDEFRRVPGYLLEHNHQLSTAVQALTATVQNQVKTIQELKEMVLSLSGEVDTTSGKKRKKKEVETTASEKEDKQSKRRRVDEDETPSQADEQETFSFVKKVQKRRNKDKGKEKEL